MKPNIDIFFRVVYTGYWYIDKRYFPNDDDATNDMKVIIIDVII